MRVLGLVCMMSLLACVPPPWVAPARVPAPKGWALVDWHSTDVGTGAERLSRPRLDRDAQRVAVEAEAVVPWDPRGRQVWMVHRDGSRLPAPIRPWPQTRDLLFRPSEVHPISFGFAWAGNDPETSAVDYAWTTQFAGELRTMVHGSSYADLLGVDYQFDDIAWSPTSPRFVFGRTSSNGTGRYLALWDERSVMQVTYDESSVAHDPVWDPSGRVVAFALRRDAGDTAMLLNIDHFTAVPVRPHDVGLIRSLAISPDGRTLAFVAERDGFTNLWLSPVREGVVAALHRHAVPDSRPVWLPDSSGLLFADPDDGLCIIDAEDATLRCIPTPGRPHEVDLRHIDGVTHVAYVASPDERSAMPEADILIHGELEHRP